MEEDHRMGSSAEEITAEMKVLSPRWPMVVGLLVVTLGFSSAYPPTLDLPTVVFYLLLWATIPLAIAYILRNKTVRVKLRPRDRYILVSDETSPTAGKLVPSRITQKATGEILVEREGRPWSVKKMELRFANSQEATKAALMLRRFLQ
jgi:hypothetical protein